ncbi:MAG: D-glycerate dehydrogenase [Parvularculaceae bacterium]
MSNARPSVFVTRKLPGSVESRMGELFDVVLNVEDKPVPRADLLAAAKKYDVVVPTLTDELDAGFFEAAGPQLKLVANFGAGVDHIDVEAAAARRIYVTNTPSVLAEDTADVAMALILSVPRRMVEGVEAVRSGRYLGWTPTWMLGRRIRGKRLCIIGMGRVGQAIARRARAFGLEIHYHNRHRVNPYIEDELKATFWPDLDAMLGEADIVSINCPHTPQTHHLLSRERLARLPAHAYLINTSRGEIIDEDALAEAIVTGRIAGAGLDVFEREPAVNPDLLNAPNVILLPHMSSATLESRAEMGERVIINIRTFFDGHRPPDRIIPAMM